MPAPSPLTWRSASWYWPAASAGVVKVKLRLSELATAGTVPTQLDAQNSICSPLAKPWPLSVTAVPPELGPWTTDWPVTRGSRKRACPPLPPTAVTTTSWTLSTKLPVGRSASSWVGESTTKPVAAMPPRLTAVTATKLEPVMVRW